MDAPPPSSVDMALAYLDDAWEVVDATLEEQLTARVVAMHALVYSPGKSGTVSLAKAMRRWLADRGRSPSSVLHKHGPSTLRRSMRDGSGRSIEVPADRSVVADVVAYRSAIGVPIDVVSSWRDPVDRIVSMLYQEIWVEMRRHGDRILGEWPAARCSDRVAQLLRHARHHPHPAEEVVPDLFEAYTFDRERESCLVVGDGFRLLVLRLEGASSWARTLERDLGYEGISITNRNPTAAKTVGQHRDATMGEIRIDATLLRNVYGGQHPLGRQLRWFYAEDELRALRRRALEQYAA